jgi:aspartate/methionine/tyrosine aminotransferase
MGARRGLRISPDRVVVFAGGKPPIGFCQQVYCNPGDEIVYPSPGYPIYESFTRYFGAVPRPLQLEERAGFSFTDKQLAPLLSRRTRLVFLNFPSNPTGGVASRADLEGIADAIQRKTPPDTRVYSDEVYEAILFDGAKHESIAAVPGMEKRTIIVSGASKTYSWTGGRLGWAVFPTAEEAAVFKNLNINVYSCLPAYNQMGAKVAIESPDSPPEIARMVAAFQERRDMVVRELRAIPGVTCQMPRGAFYAFPNVGGVCQALGAVDAWKRLPPALRRRSSPATLFQLFLLFRYHVATMDRRSFGAIGAEGRHFLRISVATGMDDLREAVRRIAEAARDRSGFGAFVRQGRVC